MSKTIQSPVAAFPGQVILYDPLTFPMVFALEDAYLETEQMKTKTYHRLLYTLLPAILLCIQEWHIDGLPDHPALDSFPASPPSKRMAVAELIAWLLTEISKLQQEAAEVPNA